MEEEEKEEELPGAGNLMDSKTSHFDDLLVEKLEEAFEQQTSTFALQEIIKIVSEYSPVDLAHIAHQLPTYERSILYENLKDEPSKVEFLISTDVHTRAAVLCTISDGEAKGLIEKMPPDEAVNVLEGVSERRYRRILDLLTPSQSDEIRKIKKHHKNTAGRLMTNQFFTASMDSTLDTVRQKIRNGPGISFTDSIFLIDDEGKLQGYFPGRSLMVNDKEIPCRQMMRPITHTVTPDVIREEVVDLIERYKVPALPVVNEENVLLGIITYQDAIEAAEDIADETIGRMAGTAEKFSQSDPMIKRFFARAPWLLATLLAGLVNMGVMSTFEEYAGKSLLFALFFVPLITGLSGNIGVQCSTVLVRSMSIGLLSAGNKIETALKELTMGFSIGIVFGIFCGFVTYFFNFFGLSGLATNPTAVGVIIGTGLLGACLAGTVLGVFSPLFFARIGVDPAIASGPIVTALNDFFSMSIYFLIATGLGSLLL